MQITITFNSMEELRQACTDMVGGLMVANPETAQAAATRAKAKKAKAAADPEATAPKTVDEAPADAEEIPVDLPEEKPAEEVDEGYRVKVRAVLAQLNKKVEGNPARKLIAGFKADKLTDVALADLPALMAKAQEALDNA